MIGDEDVTVADVSMQFEDAADEVTIDGGMKEHRRRHDQAPGPVEDHAAEIARLADDGGIAGAIEMIMHLFDQAGDLVAQDLDGDRVDGRRCCHARRSRIKLRKPSARPPQPGGMTVVASNCSTIAGPAIATPMSSRSRS